MHRSSNLTVYNVAIGDVALVIDMVLNRYKATMNKTGDLFVCVCVCVCVCVPQLRACLSVTVKAETMRPSSRVALQVLCDLHRAHMVKHHCCPGCGFFCLAVRRRHRPNTALTPPLTTLHTTLTTTHHPNPALNPNHHTPP